MSGRNLGEDCPPLNKNGRVDGAVGVCKEEIGGWEESKVGKYKMNKIYLKTAETYEFSFQGMRTLMVTQENVLKLYLHTTLDGLKFGFNYHLHLNKSIAIKDKRPQP